MVGRIIHPAIGMTAGLHEHGPAEGRQRGVGAEPPWSSVYDVRWRWCPLADVHGS